ncbi:MAG: hypothetical protein ACPGMX_10375 [Paracoccaceae bacterium]
MPKQVNEFFLPPGHILPQKVNAHVIVTDQCSSHRQHQHCTKEVPLQITQAGECQFRAKEKDVMFPAKNYANFSSRKHDTRQNKTKYRDQKPSCSPAYPYDPKKDRMDKAVATN